jgi:DNA polymerase III delta subunit
MSFDAKKALTHRVILIDGSFAAERRRVVDEILVAAGLDDPSAFDRESIVASEKPFGDWVAAASTIPFLAERRAVIVRNIKRVDPVSASETLPLAELETLPPTALLLLVDDEEPSSEMSGRDQRDGDKAPWRKPVRAAGGLIVTCEAPEAKSAGKDLQSLAKDLDKVLKPPAQRLLMEMVAQRTERALEELEKLALYVGHAKEITTDDVRRSVTAESDYSFFAVSDACFVGNAQRALIQMKKLWTYSRNTHGEAMRLVSALGTQLRSLRQAKGELEGFGAEFQPKNKPFAAAHAFARQKTHGFAANLSYEQLDACLFEIRRANLQLIGESDKELYEDVAEQMVLKICQICRRAG